MINKLVQRLIAIALVMCVVSFTRISVEASTSSEYKNAKKAYAEWLVKHNEKEYFALINIGNDSAPELVTVDSNDSYYVLAVYELKKGQLKKVSKLKYYEGGEFDIYRVDDKYVLSSYNGTSYSGHEVLSSTKDGIRSDYYEEFNAGDEITHNGKTITYKQEEKELALVDNSGEHTIVTFYKNNSLNIKAYLKNIQSKAVNYKDTLKLRVQGKPKSVKWLSSNKNIVSVSKSGIITGNKEGKSTVTAVAKYSQYSEVYKFNVEVLDAKKYMKGTWVCSEKDKDWGEKWVITSYKFNFVYVDMIESYKITSIKKTSNKDIVVYYTLLEDKFADKWKMILKYNSKKENGKDSSKYTQMLNYFYSPDEGYTQTALNNACCLYKK